MFLVCLGNLRNKAIQEFLCAPVQAIPPKRMEIIHKMLASLEYKKLVKVNPVFKNIRVFEVDPIDNLAPYNLSGALLDPHFQILLAIPKSTIIEVEEAVTQLQMRYSDMIVAKAQAVMKNTMNSYLIQHCFSAQNNKITLNLHEDTKDLLATATCRTEALIAEYTEKLRCTINFNGNLDEVF